MQVCTIELIVDILHRKVGVPLDTPNIAQASWEELGVESLAQAEILATLENMMDVHLELEQVVQTKNIADFVQLVNDAIGFAQEHNATGYIRNAILIDAPVTEVFDITNDVQLWPELFTEYQSSEVIEHDADSVTFRLTTRPEADGKQWSWVSRRQMNRDRLSTYSERITLSEPFERMAIRWWYDDIGENRTMMTWEQEFTVSSDAPVTVEQVTEYLNRQTRQQQQSVKRNLEKRIKSAMNGADHLQQVYRGVIIAQYEPGTEDKLADAFRRSDETALPRQVGVISRHLWVLGNVEVHLVEAIRPLPQIIREFAQNKLFMEIKAEADQYVKPLAPELNPGIGKEIYHWRNPDYEVRHR